MGQGERGARLGFGSLIVAVSLAMAMVWCGVAVSAPVPPHLSFCAPGSGAGQCKEPQGVAVDRDDELVYVADSGNDRVNVFDTEGNFQDSFGEVQLDRPRGIAVDNSGGGSDGDVYVVDASLRVLKFKATGEFVKAFGTSGECQLGGGGGLGPVANPIAIGPDGTVYVADSERVGPAESEGFFNRIEKYSEAGACLEEVELFKGSRPLIALAVDSSEDIYVADDSGLDGIRKYDASGALLYQLTEVPSSTTLALDDADNLFAGEFDGPFRVIGEYDASGKTLRRFGYEAIERNLRGIAAFQSGAGEVFGSEDKSEVNYFPLPPPGPIVPASTVKAAPVSNTKATLKASINPEGKVTKYHFEYVDEEDFKAGGFANPATVSTPPGSIAMVAGTEFILHPVEAKIGCLNIETEASKCLEPNTVYHFRVIADNADGEDEAEGEFKTKPPFESEVFATEVGVDTARLHAEVNPLGIPTTGHFEYVEEAKFTASGFAEASRVPAAEEIDFGSGEAAVQSSVTIFPLAPGTTYHYRVVVDDPLIEPTAPEERTLKTFALLQPGQDGPCANEAFRVGEAAFLADCRAYEMVSPLEKNNSDILPIPEALTELPAALSQSSLTGDRLTYSSGRAFGDDALSAPYAPQFIAARDPGSGWQTHSLSPPRGEPLGPAGMQADTEFKFFSEDLCNAWIRTVAEPVLAPGAIARFPNLYRRQDEECGKASYEALTTTTPLFETLKTRWRGVHYVRLELEGVSADGGEAIYLVPEKLTEDAPAQSSACVNELKTKPEADGTSCSLRLYLYNRADQSTHYVCIFPGGAASKAPCGAGRPFEGGRSREHRLDNAISADGSRVFWTSFDIDPAAGPIYMRENPAAEKGASAECSEAEAGKACTVAVSEKGEEESGTSVSDYWGAAKDGSVAIFSTGGLAQGADLYRFEVEDKATNLIAPEVIGVMGMSEDASRVYFASTADLADGAVAGKKNLYLYEEGSFKLVAVLADADNSDGGVVNLSPLALEPRKRLSRVTPDGVHAAFMSFGRLTGYDNKDAESGEADAEIFLYDASANAGEGKLVCASCNPSGARPVGGLLRGSMKFRVAAVIPRWENTLHAQRVLSEDGNRLYFTSTDVLSPRDTNGRQDVYQWEAVGAGGCDASDPGFAAASDGCLSLISSGKSGSDADLVDISPSGDDVFFSTLSSLVPQDYGLVDIYDARVGGGFPPPPPGDVECEGEACQSPPPPPQAPTPATANHEGPGNVKAAAKPKRCGKGRRRVKRGGKARCVKVQRKGKKHQGGKR